MKTFSFIAALIAFIALSACGNTKTLSPDTRLGDNQPTPTPDPTIPDGTPCGDARLTWTNPTQNTDGSPITEPLLRNVVEFGLSSTQFSNAVNISNPPASGAYRVINLEKGRTYYFAVRAVNQAGTQSDRSAVASKTITVCAAPMTAHELANEFVLNASDEP